MDAIVYASPTKLFNPVGGDEAEVAASAAWPQALKTEPAAKTAQAVAAEALDRVAEGAPDHRRDRSGRNAVAIAIR